MTPSPLPERAHPGATPTSPRPLAPGIRLGTVLLLLAAGSALLAAAVAYGLARWLGPAVGWTTPLAAALAVLVAALPALVLLLKLARSPSAGTLAMTIDASTGAATESFFFDLAEREWARARRYGSGAALLLVDLDRHGRLCETHGAAAGDAVLRELARQAVPTLRGADALARLGKSQLAVFLAQADATGALDVAERIRERSEQLEVPLHTRRLRVTVSVGVAQWRPAHLNLQSAIADAEEAVLAARRAGGNCVRAAPLEPNPLPAPGSPRNDHRARPQ